VRDTPALVLVNLTSAGWLPVPATVRRPSAVELTTAFISQHNQHSDLHRYNAPNIAKRYKRRDNRIRLTGQLARPADAADRRQRAFFTDLSSLRSASSSC
jgi:hypothetical protein